MKSVAYGLRLASLFIHYRKKSLRLPYRPIRLWVELTSYCNYRCIMCPNIKIKKQDHGYMDIALFKKILDEAEEFVFDVNLAHRGESLLHPNLAEAIDYAKKKNMFTRLHTNGSLLTEKISREIIEKGLDRLSFSFDGYEKETYETIRVGGSFDKTIQNIVRFLEIKKETGSKTPETSIEIINFENQPPQKMAQLREKFKERFKGLPLNSFVAKELHNWAGETEKKIRPEKYSVCPFPWNALVIFWDGAVLPCTQDFFGHYVVGNVKEVSLKDIWNNDRMSHLRKSLARGKLEKLKTCSNCDRVWRKGFLGVPREYLWKFLTKKMP